MPIFIGLKGQTLYLITGFEVPGDNKDKVALEKAINRFNRTAYGFNAYVDEDAVSIATTDIVLDSTELDKRIPMMIDGLTNAVHY